jgi:ABC-type amino acid transport substrate-binding protein
MKFTVLPRALHPRPTDLLFLCLVLCLLSLHHGHCDNRALSFAIVDAAPYGALLPNGKATGIYPAILVRLSSEIDTRIDVTIVPFARAAAMVSNGSADGTILFKTGLIEEHALSLVPLFSTSLVVLAAPGLALTRRGDLAGRLVGRIRGGCQDLGGDAEGALQFHELNNQQQGVAMLIARRIDVFCTSEVSLNLALAQFDPAGALTPSARLKLAEKQVWLHLRQSIDPVVAQRIKAAILRLRENGSIDQIVRAKPVAP